MFNTPSSANGGVLLGSPVNWSHPLNQKRLFWYRVMRGWIGSLNWYDLCGNAAYNLQLKTAGSTYPSVSPVSHPGNSGSVSFNGTQQYAKTTGNTTITGSGGHSMFAWVYPTSDATCVQPICSIGEVNDSNATIGMGYDNAITTGNPGTLAYLTNGPNSPTSSGLTLNLNAWNWVGYTANGSVVTFYVNGKKSTATASSTASSGNPILVGMTASGMTTYGYWPGYLDDISMWGRTLSTSEALELYDLSQRAYPGVLNQQSNILYSFLPVLPTTLTAATGTLTLTGEPATPKPDIAASNGTFALTGENASLLPVTEMSAAYGSFSLTGETVTPTPDIVANNGTFALTGQSVPPTTEIVAGYGACTLTGENATFAYSLGLSASCGNFALSGSSSPPTPQIDAGYGSFSLTNEPAVLTPEIEAGYANFVLTGQPTVDNGYGSFSLTGQPATLTPEIVAACGSFSLTGATGDPEPVLEAEYGSYSLTGEATTRTLEFVSPGGTYTLTGGNAFPWILQTGYFRLTGSAATLNVRIPTPNGRWVAARPKIWTVNH